MLQIILNANSTAIRRTSSTWIVAGPFGQVEAPILVNAAGAWADEVALGAGVTPLGLTPYRRTAVLIRPESFSSNPTGADHVESE